MMLRHFAYLDHAYQSGTQYQYCIIKAANRVCRDVPFDCIRKISCYPMNICTQYSVPLLSDAQPMPTDLYELLSMLARWPDEFIQAFITEDGEVWPLAMFSPALLYETPLALSMSKAEPYAGDVCEK